MKRVLFPCLYFFILVISFSCVRYVNPPIRNVAPIPVIEGWITTDPPPYTVNLSYSGKFTNAFLVPKVLFIPDAKVTIQDDLGDSTQCQWISNGSYQSVDSNFVGKIGRSYTLRIILSSGKTYISKPEKIEAVPPIDSVTIVYDSSYADIRPNQLVVSVNTRDPAATQNYYRWTASGYYPRKSVGDTCLIFAPACKNPYDCTCSAFCEQFIAENDINILSDQYINGKEIIGQPVFYSPIYWFGKHFIEIKQYSLTQFAYQFWEQYLAQTNRTGSILDPLPSSLTGNLRNPSDSNDIALGLFSASDVYSKKIIIVPLDFQEYWLESIAGRFIVEGSCHFAYPNTLPNDTDAPGWENAQVIDFR